MDGSLNALSAYRFDCCLEALEDARLMYDHSRYKNCLNRAYYSVFHAMRAVNALGDFDSSKHSGVIAHFNQNHVKNGDFPKEAAKIIRLASEQREFADYRDFYIASKEEALAQIRRAEIFCESVRAYLINRGIISK